MININDSLNFINPLKIIKSFINSATFNWAAAAGIAISALSSRSASKKAAAGQASALSENKRQYDIGQSNLEPYRTAGEWGLSQYRGMLQDDSLLKWGGFSQENMQEDPGYQFRLQQGYQGLDRMSAKMGQRMSGARGIGLMNYGQQMASQEFGASRGRSLQDYGLGRQEGLERLSQFSNLASSGQQAAGSMSNLGANYASSQAGAYTRLGEYQAAGRMGMGNALTSGLAAYQ